LHTGVATENILDGYINAIKVLQRIDANGILLTAVTQPIKVYLRSRPDTIRCVVKMLTQVCMASFATRVVPSCFSLMHAQGLLNLCSLRI
jgi:anaphase-promoting complex subunit 2